MAEQDGTIMKAMQAQANNAVVTVIARYGMILVTAVGMPLAGFVGKRIIDASDRNEIKLDLMRDDMVNFRITIADVKNANIITNSRIDSTNTMVNARLDEIGRTNTSRTDAISQWVRRSAEEIDKLKDNFYRSTPKGN